MKVPGGLAAMRRTFTIANYRYYVIGNWASTIGLWVQRVAIGWVTWELTHSTAWLGAMALAESGPTIFFALFAGTLIDRIDYLKLLRVTQFCTMLYSISLALCTFTDVMTVWIMFGLTIIRGIIVAFSRPSRMTVVYNLVGRELLPSALGMNSLIFNTSRFIGPAIGGAMLVAVGAAWTFTLGAVLFGVFSVSLRLIHFPKSEGPAKGESAAAPGAPARRSMLLETWEGLQYIARHDGIRPQLMLLVVTSVLAKPFTDLLPGIAAQLFDSGPHGLAMLLSAHGIGAMIASLWLASRGGLKGLTTVTLVSIIIFSLGLVAFAVNGIFWLACVLSGLLGFAFITQSVSNQTLIQSAVNPSFRGRVISVYGMVQQGMPSVGAFVIGLIAEQSGLRWPVAIGAAICLVVGLRGWQIRRQLATALETDEGVPSQRVEQPARSVEKDPTR
ncbi:MAG TPA: MFS transporter [Alphaproteobacteria bacterium]|nr:MFS transporter [Alphaproteobacteria bacterium]